MKINDIIINESIGLGDNFDIELGNMIIESRVVGFMNDGVIIEADNKALALLGLGGALLESVKQGVAEGHADQQRKIFKKNGKPVGEVGIDRESSPGVGQWYMKCYAYDVDNSGYNSYEEAVAELKHCLKQGVAEAGPFSYGKAPRKGSVADLAAKKRKEQERGKQPVDPRDQQVGVAKVTKGVAEGALEEVSLDLAKRARDKAEYFVDMDYDDMRDRPYGYSEKQRSKFQRYIDRKEPRAKGDRDWDPPNKGVAEGFNSDLEMELHQLTKSPDMYDAIYNALGKNDAVGSHLQDMLYDIARENRLHPDDDQEQIIDIIADRLESDYGDPDISEAKYQGREVPLGKPMRGDVKKSKVYVRGPKGNVVKVNFGDKKMKIKKSNPKRRKSFRARHNCANPGPRWKARYWSCRAW